MNDMEANRYAASSRSRKFASGAVAVAAVVAANLLVINADVAAGQPYYDLVNGRPTIDVAIPSAPAPVDVTRVAAPRLPDLESLDEIEFVVPVLERRAAVLPELPDVSGAPWIRNGIPPAPRASLEVAAPEIAAAAALDDLRLQVPELRLPESAAATPSVR